LLHNLKVYKTGKRMEKWKCGRCNYVVVGKEAPKVCPNCGRETEFELFDNMLPFVPFYDE
jgi:rubrerythrin